MKIYSMTATFGKLNHQTLTLKPGLNIIEAPNEWGKSTWCAFLVAMFYGIDTASRSKKDFIPDKERYQPWSGAPMSGRMDICWQGRDITIERKTKGRSIFGQFAAYETATGIPVSELTADNCGQILLGVEQSVFTRAGFLRLKDLPVQQDEILRRRLNALVTTGDESDSADKLAQKLKDVKNRCRFNRTGLLPQLEAQRQELREKVERLDALHQQQESIHQRLENLKEKQGLLENHRLHLQYEAGREYAKKLENAVYQRNLARETAKNAEKSCENIPEEGILQQNLSKLQRLKEQKEALQMELQMQPGAPAVPEALPQFRDKDPETVVEKVRQDEKAYEDLLRSIKKPSPALTLVGVAVEAVGGVLAFAGLLIPGIAVAAAGLVLLILGLALSSSQNRKNAKARKEAEQIARSYYPLDVAHWVSEAESYAQTQTLYKTTLERFRAGISGLEKRLGELKQQQEDLTRGLSLAEFEQKLLSQLQARGTLRDALRERSRLEELVSTLEGAGGQVQKPEQEDSLNLSPQQTQQQLSDVLLALREEEGRLARNRGFMESLGSREALCKQISQAEEKIQKLTEVYNAAELAMATLQEAKLELQRRFAPRIAKRAQALFSRLTGGRYERLSLQEDLSVLAAAEGEDTLHSVLWRSEGTSDQLYLALRLAVAEELTPNAPLVLDDALVRFDDERLKTALQILTETAEDKQVLLFTCQSREEQLR